MKQIEIEAQELSDGTIKILDIRNCMTVDKLTEKYMETYPHCYKSRLDNTIIRIIKYNTYSMSSIIDLVVDTAYTKEEFNEVISLLKQCGENLKKSKECKKSIPFIIKI